MVNQHYLSHNVVIPDSKDPNYRASPKDGRNRSPYFDPNYLIPLKPNQLNDEHRSALRARIVDSPAAGVTSEIYPSGPNRKPDPYN